MPINAGAGYFTAEKKFQEAKSAEERLRALQEMLKAAPKHKGAETLLAEITKRIKKTKQEIAKQSEQRKKAGGFSLSVKKEGIGQITVIGLPNSGKSTLVSALTNATITVANYPFTTTLPEVGMLDYQGAQIQLVEIPPIVKGSSEGKSQGAELLSIVRNADAVCIVVNSEKPLKEFEIIRNEMLHTELKIYATKPKIEIQKSEFKGIVVTGKEKLKMPFEAFKRLLKESGFSNANVRIEEKIGREQVLEALNNRLEYKRAMTIVLPHKKTNIEELRSLKRAGEVVVVKELDDETKKELGQKLFNLLDKVLVFTKKPGDAVASLPLAVSKGATAGDVAKVVHKEIAQKLKFAKVWGSTKFGGQRVARNYPLKQGDVIEFYF